MSIISESENIATMTVNHYERILRERDEAIRQFENLKASSIHTCHDQCQRPMCVLRRERDEAREELSSIHRWIERNHADGFIDSLTYSQNLERVTDNWYDRIDAIEKDSKRFVRERDEAREAHIRECEEAHHLLSRIARKGEFMDMEGQRLVVSDWLARRHITKKGGAK